MCCNLHPGVTHGGSVNRKNSPTREMKIYSRYSRCEPGWSRLQINSTAATFAVSLSSSCARTCLPFPANDTHTHTHIRARNRYASFSFFYANPLKAAVFSSGCLVFIEAVRLIENPFIKRVICYCPRFAFCFLIARIN